MKYYDRIRSFGRKIDILNMKILSLEVQSEGLKNLRLV